jgi:hypothetical protein
MMLMAGFLLLVSCGQESEEASPSETFVSRDAIHLEGEDLDSSYLKISSTTEGQSAVSVTDGGNLTLHDATIFKSGEEDSGSPTYGKSAGGASDQPPPAPDIGAPPEASASEGSDEGGLMPQGVDAGDENPGPGASRAGVYAGSGGTISLFNVSIETATGEGKGIYASGEGSSVALVNGTITTDGSTAHGILVTHKGVVSVENVTIITKGEHSSAVATFRGNGTVTAVGGTYTAFGKYSAGIYSAGDISATDVICKSISDNAAVLEGGSRIVLHNSVLWSRQKGAVMIYQSFSSDAPIGPSEFEMIGGSISAEDGPIFYVTNTTGKIYLKHVNLFGASGVLLSALKGDWGVDLSWAKPTQGGDVTIIADEQRLAGDLVADEFSTIDVTLEHGSRLEGAVNADNAGKAVRLALDASSMWHVTGDSHLTGLKLLGGAGTANIVGNGHTVYYTESGAESLGGRTFELPRGGTLKPE